MGCLYGSIPFAILWSIWKERCEAFQRSVSSFHDILDIVMLKIGKWATCHKEFENTNPGDYTLETFMRSRPIKVIIEKRSDTWRLEPSNGGSS